MKTLVFAVLFALAAPVDAAQPSVAQCSTAKSLAVAIMTDRQAGMSYDEEYVTALATGIPVVVTLVKWAWKISVLDTPEKRNYVAREFGTYVYERCLTDATVTPAPAVSDKPKLEI